MSTLTDHQHGDTFRPDVEGLRAVAILLVVCYHAGLPVTPGGYVGVDIFFVLSGYLITGLLKREIDTRGRIRFCAFYARRARRLLPAAASMVVVTLLAARLVYSPQELVALAKDAITTSLYASNLWFAHISTNYLAADATKSPLLHTWSLAVEEQFYLVWPALTLLAYRGIRSRPSRTRLIFAMGILLLVSLLLCQWLTSMAQPWAFFSSGSRAWEFAAGGIARILPFSLGDKQPALRKLAFWSGGAAILVATTRFNDTTLFPGWAALLPVTGAVLMLISHSPNADDWHHRLLANGPMQWLGARSYSWYLWHWPVLILTQAVFPDRSLPLTLGCLVLSLGLADLSFRWVENPLRFHPLLVRSPAYSLAGALLLTLLCTGLSQWWRHNGTVEAHTPTQIPYTLAMHDVPKKIYDTRCQLGLLDVKADKCVFGDPTASTTLVLFGDSHAAQWFPALNALSQRHHWRLISLTKSACPVAWVNVRNRQLGRPYTECNEWRRAVVNRILKLRPALVVIGYYRYVTVDDGGAPVSRTAWIRGIHHTLSLFSHAGIPIAVMRDSPRPGFNVPDCLARQAQNPWLGLDCDFPRQPALDSVEYRLIHKATAHLTRISYIDLSRSICATSQCDPVDPATGTVEYRDSHHLTRTFVREITPALDPKLSALMRAG